MDDFNKVLAKLRAKARNTTEQGRFFERLVKFWLQHDPVYKNQFTKVQLWAEWRAARGESQNDIGIDLVAEEPDGDRVNYWAIQAKFYAPETAVNRADIDTFFTASGQAPFTHRMFVSTTDKWGKNAEDALRGQKIPCTLQGFSDMRASGAPWASFLDPGIKLPKTKKSLKPHQREAMKDVIAGFAEGDRGRLIMACGTGKTFTALKIAEKMAPKDGSILFLMPSLSLLSQALREWSAEAEVPQRNFVVCSDSQVGRDKDEEDILIHDLALPATTDSKELARKLGARFEPGAERLNIVFSTYHSIDVVATAQKNNNLPPFDLVICDEAHRTTGVERAEKDRAYFTAIHDADYVRAKKRLYMTATPRLYKESAKAQAKEHDITLCSMDDEKLYGKELHRLSFSEAVRRDLLSDYKVLVLTIDEKSMAKSVQESMANDGELKLRDAIKLVGCWNGLAKRFKPRDDSPKADRFPMRRAVAFTRRIADSQQVKANFQGVVREYMERGGRGDALKKLVCEVEHVDGTMNALERNGHLEWLRDEPPPNTCRILSNARCLTEGVDVPSLDAVMFLDPRNSQVDVVQAVGRVMRKAKGKNLGYVILPVVIPAGEAPEKALADNKNYKVVWDVLRALRAHDERFNAMINSIDLNKDKPDKIEIIGVGEPGDSEGGDAEQITPELPFPEFEKWSDAIFARLVLKCGDRRFWEDWAKDVAQIAQTIIVRINGLLQTNKDNCRQEFGAFLAQLQQNLNPAVAESDAVEMLAQHIITRPVFDALFGGHPFAAENPVSQAMQKMLDLLDAAGLKAETEKLAGFYQSVRERASGIDNAEGKQRVMIELYEKFFSTAFKKDSKRLGIVYTPVQVVDFILASADAALRKEFNKGLADKNVHILDPFAGTGTFIARLLQSPHLIADADLRRKYRSGELHANEIVLLAYYIAAVNIETSYHYRIGGKYRPFGGIVLADTFQLDESEGRIIDDIFPVNSARAIRQKKQKIRVIIGNPPYAVGQTIKYPRLNSRITDTYAKLSAAANKNSLYDSYFRALRWASDRIGDEGIVAFVTNGGFIDGNAAAGVRKSLINEFSSIYCLNMRGDARTSGEQRRMEKGNVFGGGTRTPVAITLLVKRHGAGDKPAKLYYHDIGDYLTSEEKLTKLHDKNHAGFKWQNIKPDAAGDWINQRHPEFLHFLPMGLQDNKGKTQISPSVFRWYSGGVKTNKDAWVYNFSRPALAHNMRAMIEFYNSQVADYRAAKAENSKLTPDDFVSNDTSRISWDRELKADLAKGKTGVFADKKIRKVAYRPFCAQHLYFDRQFNNMVYRMPMFFPQPETENRAICVPGIGAGGDFSVLMTKTLPDLSLMSAGQCFPLYYYTAESGQLADGKDSDKLQRRDNIPDSTLAMFRKEYKNNGISKEDIFYYVYGVLHSPSYREKYANDLHKMLPRIPFAPGLKNFRAFSAAGRKLGNMHANYEDVPEYTLREKRKDLLSEADYAVRKIRFAPAGAGGNRRELDKKAVIINDSLTLEGIPPRAYDYAVNGKSPLEWIIERYQKSVNKDSGIANDPNKWSDNPQYIVSLLKRAIRLSIDSAKIIAALPPLKL
ncbi:MAG: DEAD/DEAH box helicase [Gammaproteobacteria bacterium]